MKRLIAISIVLMVALTFGVVAIHAQQADTATGGMMMNQNCPMHGVDMNKCMVGNDGKCPMAAEKCPMASHHVHKTADGAQ